VAYNGKDLFQEWKDTGVLPDVLNFIKESSRKLISQAEMCRHLGIHESQFSRLKKKYPIIEETMVKAKLDLKRDLIGAMYKKALGYETIDEEQYIEDKGSGKEQKRKIHRTKKQVPPDYKAIVYLLNKNFGREYSDKAEELNMMEKKLHLLEKEEWNNAGTNANEDSDDEDIGA